MLNFLQLNDVWSMQQLHDKFPEMNSRYNNMRGKIVKAERRITDLPERREIWAQYNKPNSIRKRPARLKPEKRELFEPRYNREVGPYDAAAWYLKKLKDSGEGIIPRRNGSAKSAF